MGQVSQPQKHWLLLTRLTQVERICCIGAILLELIDEVKNEMEFIFKMLNMLYGVLWASLET